MSKINESTVARIAGNLASGAFNALRLGRCHQGDLYSVAFTAVALARAIVAETERTELDLLAAASQEKPA